MADKSFEQQIKEQLADLRMLPDAAVWVDVAAALHKERKRRWLIWLFLLLAGCGGASFWAYYQFNKPGQQVSVTAKKTTIITEQPTKETLTIAVTEKIQITESIQPHTSGKFPGINKVEKSSSSPIVTLKVQTVLPLKPIVEIINDPVVNGNFTDLPAPVQVTIDTPNANKTTRIEKPMVTVQMITTTRIDTVFVTNKQETSKQVILPKVAGTPSTTIKKNKWQWNLAVDAGSSGISRSLGMAIAREAYAGSYANLPGSVAGQSANFAPIIKNAFSFGMQLQTAKQISKKHSIGISLGYSLFRTGISVGRRIDSTTYFSGVNNYNTNGYYYNSKDSVGYTNQYHFLRAGFDLYTPFRLFKKVLMRWQLGTGLNVLVATNGLHYDANSGRLFRNSSLMTTVQTQISTGFDISIGKQPFLYLGPNWQYFISNLSKQSGTNQHLFLSSVRLSLILQKKKK